jgi:hypothetical protein
LSSCDVLHDVASNICTALAVGVIPGFGGTQRLPRLVGLEKALTMMLQSKPIKAEEGLTLGLVAGPHRCFPPRHRMSFNSTREGSKCEHGCCPPRHRMPFHSTNEGSKRVSMTLQAISVRL